MYIPSASAGLPKAYPLGSGSLSNLGSSPSTLSTPPPGGTGYSMADTFEAAPQQPVAGGGYGYGNPAGPAVNQSVNFAQQVQALSQQVDAIGQAVQEVGASIAAGAAGPDLSKVTGDPRLLQATQEIAQDPQGAKLVQAAGAQGLNLQVGQLPPGVMGETLNGTITLSPQALSNKPDLIHTLGHELGHAATPNDGDSIAEEQAVDQLGQQIQQRIAPGPTFQLDIGSYQGLPQDNGIRSSLAQIGL